MRRLGVLLMAVECIVGLAVGVMASRAAASRDQPQASANYAPAAPHQCAGAPFQISAAPWAVAA
jgi:hypothetical protein